MSYVALSRLKTLSGLNLLGIKEKNILTWDKNKSPCDELAVRELYRLRLSKIGIRDLVEVNTLLDWITEYIECVSCKKWICKCVCV
jgi:hypothetical protein